MENREFVCDRCGHKSETDLHFSEIFALDAGDQNFLGERYMICIECFTTLRTFLGGRKLAVEIDE